MTKPNVVLLLVFVGLLGAIFALENPFAGDVFEQTARRERDLFPNFDSAKVARVEIRTKENSIAIERSPEGSWVLPGSFGYRARSETVAGLFERVRDMKVRTPISEGAENFDAYNVGESAISVRLADASGAPVAEFVQGKFAGINPKDPDFERKFSFAAYVRRTHPPGEENLVYLIEQFYPLGTTAAEWLDTALVRFSPDRAVEIAFEGPLAGDARVRCVKEAGEWKVVEPFEAPAKKEAVEGLVNSFAYSVFKDVVSKEGDLAAYGLDAPQFVFRARLDDGSTFALRFGNKADEQAYYCSKEDDAAGPFVYTTHSWSVENLKKGPEDLRAPPPAPPEPAPSAGEGTPEEPPEGGVPEAGPEGAATTLPSTRPAAPDDPR